jgi:hypothetical protein
MFHSNTELLIDYWRTRRAGRPMPRRADIEPSGFVRLAPRVFVAQFEPGGDVRFRFAGEIIVELHGRSLGGESLLRLWRPDCRARLSKLLGAGLIHAAPMVIAAETPTNQAPMARLEVGFAPLIGPDGTPDRFLGLYQPLHSGWLGELGELSIQAVNGLASGGLASGGESARLRLAALYGRRIA